MCRGILELDTCGNQHTCIGGSVDAVVCALRLLTVCEVPRRACRLWHCEHMTGFVEFTAAVVERCAITVMASPVSWPYTEILTTYARSSIAGNTTLHHEEL